MQNKASWFQKRVRGRSTGYSLHLHCFSSQSLALSRVIDMLGYHLTSSLVPDAKQLLIVPAPWLTTDQSEQPLHFPGRVPVPSTGLCPLISAYSTTLLTGANGPYARGSLHTRAPRCMLHALTSRPWLSPTCFLSSTFTEFSHSWKDVYAILPSWLPKGSSRTLQTPYG